VTNVDHFKETVTLCSSTLTLVSRLYQDKRVKLTANIWNHWNKEFHIFNVASLLTFGTRTYSDCKANKCVNT